MQVMIVEEDAILRTRITGALAPEGVDILAFGRLGPAKEAARRANVDILVLGESVEGRLASDVALLAEWRNPRLGSILLSDRDSEDAEELFDLIPSLQAVLARGTGPRTLARMAIHTARSQEGIVVLQEDQWATPAIEGLAAEPEQGWPSAEAAEPALLASALPVQEAEPAQEEEPTASQEEPALLHEEPAPIREAVLAPVEEAPAPVRALPLQETLAPLRERLAQAQEGLVALEMPAPVQELPARRPEGPEATPGVLFALPSFLRDADGLEGAGRPDGTPATPHPAMLPLGAAAPRRRLHLA